MKLSINFKENNMPYEYIKELDNLRRNISKYESEYSIDSDMGDL